jgi:hypothetical protein
VFFFFIDLSDFSLNLKHILEELFDHFDLFVLSLEIMVDHEKDNDVPTVDDNHDSTHDIDPLRD